MCVGILTAALSIGSTVAGFIGAQQAAKAQVEYQTQLQIARNEQIRQNAELTARAYNDQIQAVNSRQMQEDIAASQQAQAFQRENTVRRGTAQAALGETGAAGVNRDILMAEFDRTQTSYMSSLSLQQDFRDQSVFFETRGMQAQAEGRAQSIQPYIPAPVNGPSLFGAAMDIGMGAMKGYDAHLRYTGQGYANPDPTQMNSAPGFFGAMSESWGMLTGTPRRRHYSTAGPGTSNVTGMTGFYS